MVAWKDNLGNSMSYSQFSVPGDSEKILGNQETASILYDHSVLFNWIF